MSTITQAHSGDAVHLSVAKYYISQGTTAEDIMKALKASHYQVVQGGIQYKVNAISIVNFVNGYRQALEDINNGIKAGSHACSKAKGLYRKASKAKQANVESSDSEEVQF